MDKRDINKPVDKPPDTQDQARHPATPDRPAEAGADEQALSFLQITASALAAAFGVQSSRNRERDFSRGKVSHFIVAGVVGTALFVLIMVLVVNLVLGSLTD